MLLVGYCFCEEGKSKFACSSPSGQGRLSERGKNTLELLQLLALSDEAGCSLLEYSFWFPLLTNWGWSYFCAEGLPPVV